MLLKYLIRVQRRIETNINKKIDFTFVHRNNKGQTPSGALE